MLSENGLNLLPAFLRSGFFPIISVYDEEHVLRVAAVVRSFSINIIEITMRGKEAFACIEALRKNYPDMLIGAGSILDESSFVESRLAGADFFVSPCFHASLADYALHHRLAYVPAVMTPSELFQALSAGFQLIKIFPADKFGTDYLRAIAKPFARFDFRYLPTGGISSENLGEYLQLPQVVACGISSFIENEGNEADNVKALSEKVSRLCAIRDAVRANTPDASRNT